MMSWTIEYLYIFDAIARKMNIRIGKIYVLSNEERNAIFYYI